MLIAPAPANTKEHVEALLTEQTHEGRGLDYKQELNVSTDSDKKEFARDIASFANAGGGFIVFGVEEAKAPDGKTKLGYPERLLGIECASFDATKLQLESIALNHLDPKPQGISFHAVEGYERGPIVIVYVPRSWNGPHMLSSSKSLFFSRGAAGRRDLDVHEIRAAFLGSTEIAQRIQGFRDSRVGRIVSGETPVPVGSVAKCVVHVVPIADDFVVDVSRFEGKMSPMSFSVGGFYHRYNIDGFVTYDGSQGQVSWGYSMALRNGSFEGVTSIPFNMSKDPPIAYATRTETEVVDATKQFSGLIRAAGYDGPLSVLICIVGLQGKRFVLDDQSDFRPFNKHVVDRDVLILPDVLIEPNGTDFEHVLKPAFDAMWQASGYKCSLGYDQLGNWVPGNHPR